MEYLQAWFIGLLVILAIMTLIYFLVKLGIFTYLLTLILSAPLCIMVGLLIMRKR